MTAPKATARRVFVTTSLALALAVAPLAALPLPPPGDYKLTIQSGGMPRHFILHLPIGYATAGRLPLVLVLHGAGGTAMGMVHSTQFDAKADAEHFFVAYLQGTGTPRTWNTGIAPGLDPPVDDVTFVRDVIKRVARQFEVDQKRVYEAGFSAGAIMSHRLAAELPTLLAAVAVVEGTDGMWQADGTLLRTAAPTGLVSVLIVHGKLDDHVPYYGGVGGISPLVKLAVSDAVAEWTTADSCAGDPVETTSADGNITVADYTHCAAPSEVALITIESGEHQWPTLLDAAHFAGTDAVWAFFSHHAQP